MQDETRKKFIQIYYEKQRYVDWMIDFGNPYEKAVATIIKRVALEANIPTSC